MDTDPEGLLIAFSLGFFLLGLGLGLFIGSWMNRPFDR